MHFRKLFKQEIVCLGRCGNSGFFVSEENNGDDNKRRIYFSIQSKPKFRKKFKPPKIPNSQTP
jgi:hypothetical protein